jgi:hypothetical protein
MRRLSEYEVHEKLAESVFYIPKHARQSKAAIAIAKRRQARQRRQMILTVLMMIIAAACFYLLTVFAMSY